MTKNSRLFIVPGTFEQDRFAKLIKGLTVTFDVLSPSRSFDLLDCHDQSLRASGRLLIETEGALHLLQEDVAPLAQTWIGKGRFVQDLPDGPVRTALRGFPKLRALMSLGSGTGKTGTFAVLDDLQKTQVRGDVLLLSTKDIQVTLLNVHPMRGYDRAFEAVCAALSEMLGAASRIEQMFHVLLPKVAPYVAKPKVSLGTNEPSIQVATDIIRTFLTVARQNEAGVIADIDTEFLHDYRISLRRIRSVLSLFKGVFSPERTIALKREFSELMEPTGRVRDLDVYLLEKDTYFNLIPDNLHVGAEAMFAQFSKERTSALAELSRRFQSAVYNKQMRNLALLFAEAKYLDPGPNAERGAYDYACVLIWKRYRKVCKLARRITPDTPDEVLHELRIECKKLRYLMEFFAPLFDRKDFKTLIKPLKKLQDNLGLFNDYSVQQEALLSFVVAQSNTQGRANAQLAMAVGGLIAVLSQRQAAERASVIANFQHFDSPNIQHLFRSMFRNKED
ncbi:CHAD domain-containing protein [Ruegeria lacuscaerulensis]|uniref:CHAD domain-containing protein n=1 Tax=Ruegeria lacuscaerulensis TaxID=55218 RepID=UPI00147A885B|nr:CHAD domain-containing protein [Ruegeria lacuscaerulensis]